MCCGRDGGGGLRRRPELMGYWRRRQQAVGLSDVAAAGGGRVAARGWIWCVDWGAVGCAERERQGRMRGIFWLSYCSFFGRP
jgi:hypothetical protein